MNDLNFPAGIFGAAIIFFICLITGLLIIASGELLLAVWEIALNTRKESHGSQYKALQVIAEINVWLGWILIIGGLFVAVYSILMAIRH